MDEWTVELVPVDDDIPLDISDSIDRDAGIGIPGWRADVRPP